jgi:ABC-2 type transport system permease protein
MSALLQAELLKLRTTRTFVALVAAALGLSLLIGVLTASLLDVVSAQDARDAASVDVSSVFILVLAIVGMAGEWRHRTITGTVLAAPDRYRLLAAKIAAYALAGVALSFLVTVVSAGAVWAILAGRDQATPELGDLVGLLWRNMLVAALFGALGAALGALVRNQPGAIVLVLVVMFVVEPTLLALAPEVGRFGPLVGAPAGLLDDLGDDEDLLPAGLAALVLAGWVAALGAAAAVALQRRDVT